MNRNQIIILFAIAVFKAFLGLQQPSTDTDENIEKTKVTAYSGMQTVDPNRFRVNVDTLAQDNSRKDHPATEYFHHY